MRRPRLLAPDGFTYAMYHCVSRVVNRERVLGDKEKRQFLIYMRLYSRLLGLRVVTYCLMDNHFHLLVEVPRRPDKLPTNEELIAMIRSTLGDARADDLAYWFNHWRKQKNFLAIEQERERWFRQMWNLAAFMKVLKQRFSQWFNGTRGPRRVGTLWEERYRSTLIENGEALRTMAAYIDLNPIRAKVVKDPKDYRWSGYGEAAAGQPEAQAGLLWLARQEFADGHAPAASADTPAEEVISWYRSQLYARGAEERDAEGTVIRHGFTEEEIQAVLAAGGRVPMTALLRLRVRYFTDGAVLGSQSFVESVFQAHRARFPEKRVSGARRMKRLDLASPLRVLRGLAVKAVE